MPWVPGNESDETDDATGAVLGDVPTGMTLRVEETVVVVVVVVDEVVIADGRDDAKEDLATSGLNVIPEKRPASVQSN
jgi:hypothetical protein